MTYQANIPLPGDKPSVSQGDLLQNFIQINSQFGLQHNALDSAAHDGKHKYVTLQRGAGALPVNTEMNIAQASTGAGNPYFQCITPAQFFQVPISHKVTGIAISSGTHAIFDFATFGLPANNAFPQMGFLLLFDQQAPTAYSRTLFSPFAYVGGTLYLPGASSVPPGQGQVASGSQYLYFKAAATVLQLVAAGVPAGDTATLIITGISV